MSEYPYTLPVHQAPLVRVSLDAAHADAFTRASKAAVSAMRHLNRVKDPYGVLLNHEAYFCGPFHFSTLLISPAEAVETLGDGTSLDEQRQTLVELRNQLSGHVRHALQAIREAIGQSTVYLVFVNEGPLLVLPPSPYRLATLSFSGAKTMDDEQRCVRVNKASAAAYRGVWAQLDEHVIRSDVSPAEDVEEDRLGEMRRVRPIETAAKPEVTAGQEAASLAPEREATTRFMAAEQAISGDGEAEDFPF